MDDPDVGRRKIVDLFGDLPHYAGSRPSSTRWRGRTRWSRRRSTKKMDALRAELAGPDPTPIERLLAERAAFCWLVLWKYEATWPARRT